MLASLRSGAWCGATLLRGGAAAVCARAYADAFLSPITQVNEQSVRIEEWDASDNTGQLKCKKQKHHATHRPWNTDPLRQSALVRAGGERKGEGSDHAQQALTAGLEADNYEAMARTPSTTRVEPCCAA